MRTFAALERLFNLRILCSSFESDRAIDAWLFLSFDESVLPRIDNCAAPIYAVPSPQETLPLGNSQWIDLMNHSAVDATFRGRSVACEDAAELRELPAWLHNLTPLATKGNRPIWAVRSSEGKAQHFTTADIPALEDGGSLYHHFHGNRYISLLPLLCFLREIAEDRRWTPPPLQACFMFDDPNLHWPTYGHIDFAKLARHANRHNYHVASATIPLDAWFVHAPTAAIFRENASAISLLMHGNDHVRAELANGSDDHARLRILRQAVFRIQKLERRSGVHVSRVMAPPHGACSQEMLSAMPKVNIEAACISKGSLRHYNRQADWIPSLGFRACEIIRGLPVFHRFRVAPTCQNSILLAAFLRQPIIPVGHHQDVADGLQIFADLADFVNTLGIVNWSNMASISRSHYSHIADGRTMFLKPHTLRVDVVIPPGIDRLVVQSLPSQQDTCGSLRFWINGTSVTALSNDPLEPIPVMGGQTVRVAVGDARTHPEGTANLCRPRPWPIIRRLVTETRDRLAPTLRRAVGRR